MPSCWPWAAAAGAAWARTVPGRRCWRSALEKARDAGARTVFAPLISAGIYGYPPDQALAVAVSEIGAFLTENDLDVTLVIYDRAAFRLPAPLRGALAAHAGIGWGSSSHTALPTFTTAQGAGAEILVGMMENADIGERLKRLLGKRVR